MKERYVLIALTISKPSLPPSLPPSIPHSFLLSLEGLRNKKSLSLISSSLPPSLPPSLPSLRVKEQRMKGQSGIGEDFRSWKTDEEMRMRQQYD